MCWSSATLFYGTFVKAIPLFSAADAWTRIKPAFLALDIISSRRRKGTLRFEQENEREVNVAKLPVEVMELVKRELVDVELQHSDVRINPRPCSNVDRNCWCETTPGVCLDGFLESGGMRALCEKYDALAQHLLVDFRLCRPQQSLVSLTTDSYADIDSFLPIALPLRSSSTSHFPSAVAQARGEYDASHGLIKLDPTAMILPPDASSRFRRLLSLFRLITYDPTKATIQPLSPSEQTQRLKPAPTWPIEAKDKGFDLPDLDSVLKEGEEATTPVLGWHIWASSPCCY